MRDIKFEIGFTNHSPIIVGWNELIGGEWGINIITHGSGGKIKYKRQFIGLKDNNGKEIYEGDIISYGNYSGNPDRETECLHEVYFNVDNAQYSSRAIEEWDKYDGLIDNSGKVIGNIYKNPELINPNKQQI